MKRFSKNETEEEILRGCKKNDPSKQKVLYHLYYGYAMGIALRFAHNQEDAQEILQDSFIKAFRSMDQFDLNLSFKKWFRKIVVYTAIDKFRQQEKQIPSVDITYLADVVVNEDALDMLSEEELLRMIQHLSPGYRMVFNLYVIDGFTHKEIAEQLEITEGTSKSNLAKAKMKLKKMLSAIDPQMAKVNYG
ncbi:MAG: RNA polymerase sigma factor [Bacteroidia bacterium]|nr:RNA polymerase sigma factor [Bacteroidia bacterium]